MLMVCLCLAACSIAAATTTPAATLSPTTASSLNPTQTLQNTLYHPAPSFSSTPTNPWNAEAIHVSWNDYGTSSQPAWLSNTIVKLAVSIDEKQYTVDISAGSSAQAVATSIDSDWRVFSPQKKFVIECIGGMSMLRVSDNELVSKTNLIPPHSPGIICPTYVKWAPDESITAFVSDDYSVYFWPSDGTEPRKIMERSGGWIAWSPDSTKLAVVKPYTGRSAIADVFDTNGKLLYEVQFEIKGDSAIIGWLTDNVLISYARYSQQYYDVRTGQPLFEWRSSPLTFNLGQLEVSPNERWIFIDQAGRLNESKTNPNHSINQHDYSVYDVQEKKRISMPSGEGDFLGFVGWSRDSSKLYLVSRPAESTSTSNPATPFGLLAYDVVTHQFDLLFKDAIQVVWNADHSWAFIVFAAKDYQGNLRLAGGLWEAGTDKILGEWRVSEQMIYSDPAYDSFFGAFPTPFPISWSNDGQRVAVRDDYGLIKILNVNGTEKVLTDEMKDQVGLWWSPDDQHLLVEAKIQAWIVNTTSP
jgi:hypothetical protein